MSCAICDAVIVETDDLRCCPEHHRYFRGTRRLISVSKILSVWPRKPCDQCGAPIYGDHASNCIVAERIETARLRGVLVDHLFCSYVEGRRVAVPPGTRTDLIDDGVELFRKAARWWEMQSRGDAKCQVPLADDRHVGVCDLELPGMIVDLKATYDIDETYQYQLGGYADMGAGIENIAVLHVTKRYPMARLVKYDRAKSVAGWRTLRNMWHLINKPESGEDKASSERIVSTSMIQEVV